MGIKVNFNREKVAENILNVSATFLIGWKYKIYG